MGWFKRKENNITTPTKEKKDIPDGLWYKTPTGHIVDTEKLAQNAYVSPEDGYHVRIGSKEYFNILFDSDSFEIFFDKVVSKDPLKFEDSKKYTDRIKQAKEKTGLTDAVSIAKGKINELEAVVGCMDFSFIGGSLGSAVGERLRRAIDLAIEEKLPFVLITKSGGARMQEAATSLMQMAKVQVKLTQLAAQKLPYITILTDPTTGGVSASFAMVGDIIIAEPGALIGFAGPRVIKETIGKDLPEGFQRSEFLLEKGFVDMIVDRRDLKNTLSNTLSKLL